MRQDDAARVILVRAVEETLPDRIAGETLLEAHAAAGDPGRGAAWISRRAAYLVDHALGAYRDVLAPAATSLPAPWVCVGVAFVVGLASNYLGPTERIHVVFNPVVLLVLWNLLVYASLVVHRFVHRAPVERPSEAAAPMVAGARPPYQPTLFERVVLGRAFAWLLGTRNRIEAGVDDAAGAARVARRFAVLWWPVARPALSLWTRRLLHLSAIGLAAGAIAGMYCRGLFFAYHVVWRSTFVEDPATIAFVLRVLLGPSALVLGRPLPSPEDAVRLLGAQGDPAASWIHLYAVAVALFILLPRTLLAVTTSRRLRRLATDVELAIDGEYYRDLLQRALAVSPARLEASIRTAVADECRRFAGNLSEIVSVQLYDERIAPRLRAFRGEGGSLRELEEALQRECESFGPVLARELPSAQHELERSLAQRVRRLLGDEAALIDRPTPDIARAVGAASSGAAMHFGDTVGRDVTTMVGSIVSASVGAAVGLVAGGFGDGLVMALLVGIVESGPIGWVIGAIAGLIATGAAVWLGREALRGGVKAVPLPSAVVRIATLSATRYERIIADGRAKCGTSVREALAEKMTPLAQTIADQIWSRLMPVVGELQRPRVTPQE